MMSLRDIVPVIRDWVVRARRDIDVTDELIMITSADGSTRDYIDSFGDMYGLRTAQRGGNSLLQMISPSLMDIARQLTKVYGPGIRDSLGYPFLYFAPPPISVAPGWVITVVEWGGAEMAPLFAPHPENQEPTVLFSEDLVAKSFSHVADVSPEQIQELYLAPPVPGTLDGSSMPTRYAPRFDRIGEPDGDFLHAMIEGKPSSFEERSLPVRSLSEQLRTYQLTSYLPEGWSIATSILAPAFGQPGGAQQVQFFNRFRQPQSINTMIEAGTLLNARE
ncbi:MAG: glycohydrolase toxin TNT-related protein [Rhodoglobus sp.]